MRNQELYERRPKFDPVEHRGLSTILCPRPGAKTRIAQKSWLTKLDQPVLSTPPYSSYVQLPEAG